MIRRAFSAAGVGLLAISVAGAQTTSTGGWKPVGGASTQTSESNPAPAYPQSDPAQQPSPQAQQPNYPAAPSTYPAQQPPAQPNYQSQPPYAQQQPMPAPNYPQSGYPNYPNYPQQGPYQQPVPYQTQPSPQGTYGPVPAEINVPAGTFLTVRINQLLSSDHNQPGDAFSATLARPLVENGIVLAEPGETVAGRVTQAQKSGRVEGLAKLGVELTDLTLVDGEQIPLKTSFVSRTAPSTVGRDAAGIAATTGLGAAIGAAADWGRGAAIGAGAGAAAGIIGVLVTRGAPSVISPEQELTFRIEQPFTVSTEHSPQAFRYVQPGEYSQPSYGPGPVPPGPAYAAAPFGVAPYPYYAYPYYPYYYPGFSVFVGPGWGYGHYYYGRGYHGGYVYRGYRR